MLHLICVILEEKYLRSEGILLKQGCCTLKGQKQPSRGALKKTCSENMQQIYRRTPTPKCDFNNFSKSTEQHILRDDLCF